MRTHTLTQNTLRARLLPDGTNSNAAAGTTALTSNAIDTRGWEGVYLAIGFGAIVGTAVTSIKLQHSADDGVLDAYADVAGTAQTVADTDDFRVFEYNLYRPTKRYYKILISRGTANATVDYEQSILFRGTQVPATQGTTIAGTKVINGPASGTP